MKQLKAVINDAKALVDDNYIIFNDGKAVQVKVNKDIEVKVDNYFNSNDLYKHEKNPLENEIDMNVPFSTAIIINEDIDLTVIHINDDINYLSYNFIIEENVNATITNIYFKVVNEVKIKLDILCKDYSQVKIKSIMNCENNVKAIVNTYCLTSAYIKLDTLALNLKEAEVCANVFLIDPLTNAELTNVIINTSGVKQKYQYKIHHIKGMCKSLTNSYGISKNASNLIIDCYGIIKKDAKETVLSQKTKGIILDLYSQISAQPLLEIDEYDVIANHGASIGAIDDNDLYYLMSRGLTREQSENLIIFAFINPYYRGINNEAIVNYINKEINKHL